MTGRLSRTASSTLKKPPGEGTGPTIRADFRGNPVGRVPARGEPRVLERAVRSQHTRRRGGALITEVVIAMGILTFAMLPLAFSIVREQKLTRAYFNRAI